MANSGQSIVDYENFAKKYALPVIKHYRVLHPLEQIVDENGIVVEETLLAESIASPFEFSLRIFELRDVDVLLAAIREAQLLKVLGLNKYLMGLFTVFRHRQYVGMVFPAYNCVRDRLDVRYRMKKSKPGDDNYYFYESRLPEWSKALSIRRREIYAKEPGILNRDAVAYALRKVLKALAYVHSAGYVHTQVCAANVFMDASANVKLGGFLHARKVGSKRWLFTGDCNRHPPEAFLKPDELPSDIEVNGSFDVWSLGMFTIEMITGLRTRHTPAHAYEMALEFLRGNTLPPKLGDVDSKTLVNGKQVYDADVDSFLASCLKVDFKKRATVDMLAAHPFVSRSINVEAAKREWIAVSPQPGEWNTKRNLFAEMLAVHSSNSDLKPELLMRAVHAINLAKKEFYPIFDKVSDRRLAKDYIAIEAILAIQKEDGDWSRDVLDISQPLSEENYVAEEMERRARRKSRTPGKPSDRPLSADGRRDRSPFSKADIQDYQRVETIFFVKKDWTDESRHLFVHLQFARWLIRGILSFADVIRVVDEFEDIFKQYIASSMPEDILPGSISFISGLRKSLVDAKMRQDPDNRKYNHIHVEVALKPDVIAGMKKEFDKLAHDDPVELPPKKTTLQAAATYRDLDTKHVELLENVMLGKRRVDEWEFHPEQRLGDMTDQHTQLRYLLEERRRNPNLKFMNQPEDAAASNQIRTAKIWGDYDRDFIFRFCKFNIPYQIEEKDARMLYGSPQKWLQCKDPLDVLPYADDLDKQLLRTSARHDQDVIYPFKYHDEVEARRAAISRLEQLGMEHEARITRLEALLQQARHFDPALEPNVPLPAPGTRRHAKRLPALKKKSKQ